ncbi:LysR family transcriptional regulator [Verticiella sediminum]|uniref:LysR family transcriptional regulator n=1 Tax=Verticiella sediminum TaxID=1247510 RepID=A0A556AZ14_9BURK|nr:LysR family transcriptional regulator [Verticiella sediminum]TSH98136.1 LysR family transcriptional regulator [Verticiella sediminum]
MRYDLTDLRLFLNVGETLNLTRAAERSFLSLPAASTRIKQMEDAFQTPLLVRQVKGVSLTPAGATLLAHAREVFRELECMHADLQPYASGVKGRLRVLANTTSTNSFLPDALSSFLAANPEVDVELEEKLSKDIVSALNSGAADLGIVAGNVAIDGLEALPLFSDELVVIASVNHPMRQFKRTRFADLLDNYRFVGISQVSAIQSFLDNIANAMGKRISLRIQVGSFDAVCRMVEANAGIAVIPLTSAERYNNRQALRLIQLEDEWAHREIQVCRRPGGDLPRFAETFIEHLVRAAQPARTAKIGAAAA